MCGLAFGAALLAFALFGLATDGHHRQRLGAPCPKRRATLLRGLAWSCVAVDFLLSVLGWGWIFGPIGWVATLMVGAAATFCVLNFAPAR